MTTIADILARVAAERAAWAAPHERALLARAAMLALHREAFAAASAARDMGVALVLAEHADDVALTFRGRSLRFHRSEGHALYRIATGVVAMPDRELALPALFAAGEWAETQMAEALGLLMT